MIDLEWSTDGGLDHHFDSLAELYHENSKTRRRPGASGPTAEAIQAMSHGFKVYANSPSTPLPPPALLPPGSDSLGHALRTRRSVRRYEQGPLPIRVLGDVLFSAYGMRDPELPFRTVPSAGGLYPLELYLVNLEAGELPVGAYHYDLRRHSLDLIPDHGPVAQLRDCIFVPEAGETAAAMIVITGVFGRSRIKYGERAYRFAHLEAGHVGQNIALTCTCMGIGFCPFGGFVDDEVNNLLNLDGVDEAAIYLGTLGLLSRSRDAGSTTEEEVLR
ncbi:SagB-type dehydrogenase domain-containing protein [Actinopolymorpha cephalotaxi]|uniref:SagB-type dehydrogenase domain-containing protein n=1 Tax=Actinopolymorpha cephalotaxi TaxID=504797 RepID=A0A1I3A5Z0_9ACTN|nr:SagB/ThcOx family dehydrogenase [Actinopolymorpha cephalotaxi]NYH85341.1 SagB-type dehydrogenase family enzyme [Actinopolymorpha cephalotaxi]SFH45129.1 SagB-type dehydrogenase domain-containing protein [Actinopolymorpha cephalotaxi]